MRKLMRESKKINNSSSSPKVQKIINEAIALIKSNKKEDAHQFLQQKIKSKLR
jgi:hypothetical protein